MPSWQESYRPARLAYPLGDGVVECHLSPRHCKIRDGQHGFCRVRANRDGALVTLNYGKAVHHTEETIETEAVYHFMPGARILSMGNIGCMLNCAYCHNWKTSQARYVEDQDVHHYTPAQVVDIALTHDIKVISWTYNDPVVWHEFILDTARLAKAAGLINLYKSAFYISTEAVAELAPYIDIFSISLKSLDPAYYAKLTTGRLEPVLEATKFAFETGRHIEVSTLMVTDLSDDEKTARDVTGWVLENLGPHVPMHFVRFHPDYKMRNSTRTPIPRLLRARAIAREMGAEHVYVGNVYDTDAADTRCNGCDAELVTRYGLKARNHGLDSEGHCVRCGRDAHVKHVSRSEAPRTVPHLPADGMVRRVFDWHGDIRALHLLVRNPTPSALEFYYRSRLRGDRMSPWDVVSLRPNESYRLILAKSDSDEVGPEVAVPASAVSNLHEVFDRAHFPTVSVERATAASDITPLPLYETGGAV
jgi:pyruvate formate lyase activating enzyme